MFKVLSGLENWHKAIALIVGLFLTGMGTAIYLADFVDSRIQEKYFQKNAGQVLEQRVLTLEESFKDQNKKIDLILNQQNQVFVELGRISGKLDTITPSKK